MEAREPPPGRRGTSLALAYKLTCKEGGARFCAPPQLSMQRVPFVSKLHASGGIWLVDMTERERARTRQSTRRRSLRKW